ncbi:MAG: serine/threonine-protein kinase [Gammaproteobacteria bacterium]|nr:serine/threonine-protein kinase [Gammaproteobacteria bacterium]
MTLKLIKARWEEIQVLLDEVLQQPENRRDAFIQEACGTDMQLRREIELLLEAERNAPTFLEYPLLNADEANTPVPSPQPLSTGDTLGVYRLCEEVGRGGMGVVYRAERQTGDFEQEVAIKLLELPSDNRKANPLNLDRFRHEQQTLASLNHPNIAQLFDGGFTESQQPYIVMEFIRGTDINRYCDARKLEVEARLGLIMQVCAVLSFAHKNLIVHRDIKPSNILINNEGQVKLLDFGIAKLLSNQPDLDLTRTGELVMTPGFAAPEQVKNQPITVTTDIYQLGLVFYELLSGQKAFSDQADSLYDLARVMCERSPTPPSEMVDASAPHASGLAKSLRGDLDAIVLKALRTEPELRYGSMQEFAADIQAHLDGRLVSARQASFRYLLQNRIRRHWRALAVSLSFILVLLVYAVTVTVQSQRIQQALEKSVLEAQKAQQVSDFMVDIFKLSDPNVSGLDKINAQQLLEKGQQDIQVKLQDAPEIRGHMLGVLGDIYYSQGVYEQSAELLQQSLVQQRTSVSTDSIQLANILTKLAISLSTMSQYEEARQLLAESLSIHNRVDRRAFSDKHRVNHAETLNAYANLHLVRGDYDVAESYFQRAIDRIQALPDGQNEMAVALNGLGSIRHYQGRFEEALSHMGEVIRIHRQIHGERHSYFTMSLNNLAAMLIDLERFEEAAELSRQSLAIQQQTLGEDHPYVGHTLRALGILSHRQGDFKSAKDYLQRALNNKRKNLRQENASIAMILQWLGAVVQDMGEFDEAGGHYQRMFEIFQELEVKDRVLGRGLCQLGSLALARGETNEAERRYEQALGLLPESGIRTAIAQLGLARVLLAKEDDLSRAQVLAEAALNTRQAKYAPGHSMLAEAQAVHGLIQVLHDPAAALPLLQEADRVLQANPLYTRRHSAYRLADEVRKALTRINNRY